MMPSRSNTANSSRRAPAMLVALFSLLLSPAPLLAQDEPPPAPAPAPASPPDIPAVITHSVEFLLSRQEGPENAEWPYEGVYRVRAYEGDLREGSQIPIGYRVGGTSITALALLAAPGYADDPARRDAVARALTFVISQREHALMNPDYDGGYDVRGWGYTYALAFLLRAESLNAIPPEQCDAARIAIRHYISAIEQTEIHNVGGWNYARGQGKEAVSPASPFMTAPTLQALFEARAAGYAVRDDVIQRALATLERGRTDTGAYTYSGNARPEQDAGLPGSVGRMLAAESTLFLAGRGSVDRVRGAVDAFIVHWKWLDDRRAKTGTHVRPYGVAPYYFYFAHFHAAQAIELLPHHDRPEYRRRLHELLFSVQLPDGTWNDRVFPRSASYGTAISLLALNMPNTPSPARLLPANPPAPDPAAPPPSPD